MYNPFKSIISGAKGLADRGASFFQNVDSGMESVGRSVTKFRSNVRGGLDMAGDTARDGINYSKNKIVKQYDRSYLGYAAEKTAKFQDGFNKTVHTLITDKKERKRLGGVARDEAAKSTLSSSGSILTGLGRISANVDKGLDYFNEKAGFAKYIFPKVSAFSALNKFKEKRTGTSLFENASNIAEKGAASLYEKASFIDEYDAESVTLEQVRANPELIPQFYVQSVSQAAPSIAISAVATIASGGSGAFVAGGLMEGGAQYTEAKSMGASDEIADLAGLTNGIASGFLESLGARGIFKNNPLSKKISSKLAGTVIKELAEQAGKKTAVQFIKSIASEGGTEAAQQIVSNAIAKVLYDEERNLMEGALESGIVGGLASGSMHAGGSIVSGSIDISQKANKAYKELPKKEKQGGYVGLGGLEKVNSGKKESVVSKKENTETFYSNLEQFTTDSYLDSELENNEDYDGEIPEGFNFDESQEKMESLADKEGFTYEYNEDFAGFDFSLKDSNIDILEGQSKIMKMIDSIGKDTDIIKNNDGTLTLYHGSENTDLNMSNLQGADIFLSPSLNTDFGGVNGAYYYGNNVYEITVDPRKAAIRFEGELSIPDSSIVDIKKHTGEKFQAAQSPQFQELANKVTELNKQRGNAKTVSERNRIDKAIVAVEIRKAKYQDVLTHTLQKKGYITTEEAISQAQNIPVFKYLSEKGQTVLREKMNNPEALGSYLGGVISYVKNPHETTLPHETFHAVMDMGLDATDRAAALDIAREESGLSEMNDLKSEEWLAQKFGEWFSERSKRTFSDKIIAIFEKIKRFLTRLELDVPKLEKLFRSVIDEDMVRAVSEFNEVGGIKEARKIFNQNQEVFTTQLFSDEALWKKEFQKRVTVESALNKLRKPVMREYAQAKLETEFNDQDTIDMEEFKRSILSDLLEVKIIESDTYANYGLDNIKYDYRVHEPKTYILNTNFNHKVKGHFNNDFDVVTQKEDLMIREQGTDFYVIRKDFSAETMESGVFQTFKNENDAQDYINNFAERRREEAGMIAHYRAVNDADMDSFNVLEMQSDVFQHGVAPLIRDVAQMKAAEIYAAKSSFKRKIKFSEDYIKTQKERLSEQEALDSSIEGRDRNIELYKEDIEERETILAKNKEELAAELDKINNHPKWENESHYFRNKMVNDDSDFVELLDDKTTAVRLLEEEKSLLKAANEMGLSDGDKKMWSDRVQKRSEKLKDIESKLDDKYNNFEITPEQKKEIALSKQFLSLKNNYEEQIVKHAVRQAAANGKSKIRFATPMTVAYIEGYVSEAGADGDGTRYEHSDMYVGQEVEVHGDTDGIVTSYDENGFYAVYSYGSETINNYSKETLEDEHRNYYDDDFVSYEDHRETEFKQEIKDEISEEISEELSEEIDDLSFEGLFDTANMEIRNAAESIKETWVDAHMEDFDVANYLEEQGNNVIEESDELFFSTDELHQERFSYQEEVDNESFSLSDIQDDDHRKIAAKYGTDENGKDGIFYKILKKKRSDLEMVTDDNGYTWWESEIQPDDRAAVELFQTKGQIQKNSEKINELREEIYMDSLVLEFKKDVLDEHPARSLSKFQNRNNELPEVTGVIGKGKFRQRGDQIITELGFDSSEEARESFADYVEKNNEFKIMKSEFIETRAKNLKQIKKLKNKIQRAKVSGTEMKKTIKRNQEQLISIINQSDLSMADRSKFIKSIKNVHTNRNLESAIPKIEERIKKLEEKSIVNTLKKRIIKRIKSTKPKKVNGKPVGKYTPEIQDLFKGLFKAVKYTQDQAQARISEIITNSEKEGEVLTIDNSLELQMLNMVAGLDNKSPEALYGLLKSIEEMIATGKAARELSAFSRKLEIKMKVDMIKESIGDIDLDSTTSFGRFKKRKGLKARVIRNLKTIGDYVALDWDGLMETLDWNADVRNKHLRKLLSVNKQENKYKQLTSDWQGDISFAMANIYGFKNTDKNMARKAIELARDEINLGTFQKNNGKNIELVFTRDQVIKKYMEFKDPDIRESYKKGNFYTEEMFEAIEQSLTEQDIQMADKMFELYNNQYKNINEVYRTLYGVNLPKNEFYSPIRRKGFKADIESGFGEFLQNSNNSTVNGGFLKSRVKNFNEVVDQGAFQSMERHMNETNYFVAWAEKARELKQIFSEGQLSDMIKEEFGSSFNSRITGTIDDFITRGIGGKNVISVLDATRSNITTSALMLSPAIFVKQLTSNIAVMEIINPVEYISGLTSYFKNWKKNNAILNAESIVLKERGSNIDRDIRDAVASEEFSKFSKRKTLINTLMMNVKMGDKGAIMPAVWAIRQARLKKGVPLNEIVEEYEQFTSSTQQSSDLSKLASVQRTGSLGKLFTMFMTSPRQYMQKYLLSVKSLFQKGGTSPENLAKVARVIFIYRVLLPVVFQFVSNFGRTDDEAMKDYKRALLIGNINGLIIVKEFADALARAVMGQMVFDPNIPIYSIVNDLSKAIKKTDFSDISLQDFADIMAAMEDPVEALTGFGVGKVKNIAGGASDAIKGDIKGGVGRMLGWSAYAMTGKGKKQRFTPEEKKILKIYHKLKRFKKDQNREGFDNLMDSLSEDQKASLKLVRNKIKNADAKKLKNSKEIKNIYQDLKDFKDNENREGFDNLYKTLTKNEKAALKAYKNDLTKNDKKKKDEESSIVLGIRGIFVDPKQTIKAILSEEEIEKVEGNLVKFKRMEFKGEGGSADVKYDMMKEMGLDPKKDAKKYKLEHIIPLTAGGRNDKNNLEIVTTKDWKSFTPVDVALGKAVMSKKMKRKDASQIARALKSSEITVQEALDLIKRFGE